MRAVACLGNYAKEPYYFEKLDIRVFCMEELCCCLKENAFLLGTEIMQDSLLKFIANQCDVPQLSRELYPLVHKKGSVSTFVTMILEYVGFYSQEEIRQVERVLKQGAHLSDFAKRKAQIDYMVEKKRYASALEEYEQLYENMPKSVEAASVLHNMGVVYAHMMMYQKAGECFLQAYELGGNEESFVAYLGARRFELTDREYVDFAAELPQQYANEMALEKILEQAGENWENSPRYMGILNMKEWRNEERRNSYEKESRMIMDSLKNEYRSSVSNG